ncbi:hypothetical protein SUDANB54_05993 [Streptomyces sp. enrichment culture]
MDPRIHRRSEPHPSRHPSRPGPAARPRGGSSARGRPSRPGAARPCGGIALPGQQPFAGGSLPTEAALRPEAAPPAGAVQPSLTRAVFPPGAPLLRGSLPDGGGSSTGSSSPAGPVSPTRSGGQPFRPRAVPPPGVAASRPVAEGSPGLRSRLVFLRLQPSVRLSPCGAGVGTSRAVPAGGEPAWAGGRPAPSRVTARPGAGLPGRVRRAGLAQLSRRICVERTLISAPWPQSRLSGLLSSSTKVWGVGDPTRGA